MTSFLDIGIVVIGRNEGERLHQCLLSVLHSGASIVYVDSGSTDGSRELASKLSVEVVELDLSIPFTAARARNTGFEYLLQLNPQIKYIQFVDGDCEIISSWLSKAQKELETRPEIGVVCGRRRERYTEASIYNRLCDLEWDTPIGETKYCGGDTMIKVEALKQVGGYNSSLIAGEEPELCVRMRQQGWKIYRIDAEMTLHDANMTHFSQWWRRSVRGGHAYAQGAFLHGKPPECHWMKETRSIWFWGLILPVFTLSLIWLIHGWSLILLSAYPLLLYKIYRSKCKQGLKAQDAFAYALFCVLAKFPQTQGQIQFHVNHLLGKQNQLIEYKVS